MKKEKQRGNHNSDPRRNRDKSKTKKKNRKKNQIYIFREKDCIYPKYEKTAIEKSNWKVQNTAQKLQYDGKNYNFNGRAK